MKSPASETRVCSITSCTRAFYSRGMCKAHYQRAANGDMPFTQPSGQRAARGGLCIHAGCELSNFSRGYCVTHYAQFRRRGYTWDIYKSQNACNWDGCGERTWHHTSPRCETHKNKCLVNDGVNWCQKETRSLGDKFSNACPMHDARFRKTGDYGPVGKIVKTDAGFISEWYVDSDGYCSRRERAPGEKKATHIKQHRWVMENHLGRKLFPGENVHHLNGDKLDNKIENLEIWETSQPPGQRLQDKASHYIQWLERYGYKIDDREAKI